MKNTVLALLAAILVIALVNLLANLGVIGSSGGSHAGVDFEYKALNAAQMDSVGFRAVAEEEGLEISEEGEINFPRAMAGKIAKINLLPRTIREIEKDGGWTFVTVTNDDHYLFRRPRTGQPSGDSSSVETPPASPATRAEEEGDNDQESQENGE